ncbi:MAG: hypothetical protein LBB90_02815, partial [Tannerella sp.]|nr:hypothetical protein [Tannerella sp.]
ESLYMSYFSLINTATKIHFFIRRQKYFRGKNNGIKYYYENARSQAFFPSIEPDLPAVKTDCPSPTLSHPALSGADDGGKKKGAV